MQVLPIARKGLDLDKEDRQRIEVALNSIRLTDVALSAGAGWQAARAVGRVVSLRNATPGVAPPRSAAGALVRNADENEKGVTIARMTRKRTTSTAPRGVSKSARLIRTVRRGTA
jgi:hypothetical protein